MQARQIWVKGDAAALALALGLGTLAFAGAVAGAGPARAEVAAETTVLGGYQITLHAHPFLTPEDLSILRLVASDQTYLTMFVPDAKGHSAMAVSPDEGFVVGGAPVPSAVALGGLPDAATAAKGAIDGCQKVAKSATPCVVVLEISPK